MAENYIEVDLESYQKKAILKYASFFVMDENTKADLSNGRKKWIRFPPTTITNIIGELSYYFNRTTSDNVFYLLDELICHLESYEKTS